MATQQIGGMVQQDNRQSMNKIEWKSHTDKFRDHSHLSIYKFIIRNNPEKVLELGVDMGAPFYYWKELFGAKVVYGIDNRTLQEAANFKNMQPLPVPMGDTHITSDFRKVDFSSLPCFDLIVDDASHWLEHQIEAINFLHKKLNDGGIYIIEDVSNIENAKKIVQNFVGNKENIFVCDRTDVRNRCDDILVIYYK